MIKKNTEKKYSNGFTLMEMIVSIGIMLAIISITFYNQSKYSNGVALKNAANEMSLAIRQAQVYGISVKEFTPGSNDFTPAYGISLNTLTGGWGNSYILFADRPTYDSIYNGTSACATGGSSECLDKIALPANITVTNLCAVQASGNQICNPTGRIDITFLRPSTDARFVLYNGAGNLFSPANMVGVKITLTSSTSGQSRSVMVYTTGQISVQ